MNLQFLSGVLHAAHNSFAQILAALPYNPGNSSVSQIQECAMRRRQHLKSSHKSVALTLSAGALFALTCLTQMAAQEVDNTRSQVPFDQPDAWAMAYVTSASLLTGFGQTPDLAIGDWMVSAEIGHIPKLSRAEQFVGLNGSKFEDLNKSPVFGRGRLWVGLPWGLVGELAYTPPLEIKGARPRNLFAIGFGKRWIDEPTWSLSTRLHGQHGSAVGDVTCPASIAGNPSLQVNPFRCLAPSKDVIQMNYYALEATAGFGAQASPWRTHATLGFARYEPQVNIRAEQTGFSNRTILTSAGVRPYFAGGLSFHTESPWEYGGEILYVPLNIRRPGQDVSSKAFWSLRGMLRYSFGSK
jgi:hypothetical protein